MVNVRFSLVASLGLAGCNVVFGLEEPVSLGAGGGGGDGACVEENGTPSQRLLIQDSFERPMACAEWPGDGSTTCSIIDCTTEDCCGAKAALMKGFRHRTISGIPVGVGDQFTAVASGKSKDGGPNDFFGIELSGLESGSSEQVSTGAVVALNVMPPFEQTDAAELGMVFLGGSDDPNRYFDCVTLLHTPATGVELLGNANLEAPTIEPWTVNATSSESVPGVCGNYARELLCEQESCSLRQKVCLPSGAGTLEVWAAVMSDASVVPTLELDGAESFKLTSLGSGDTWEPYRYSYSFGADEARPESVTLAFELGAGEVATIDCASIVWVEASN